MGKNLQRSKIIEDSERAFGSLLLVSELQLSISFVDFFEIFHRVVKKSVN